MSAIIVVFPTDWKAFICRTVRRWECVSRHHYVYATGFEVKLGAQYAHLPTVTMPYGPEAWDIIRREAIWR